MMRAAEERTPTRILASCDRCGRQREIPVGRLLAFAGVELKRTAYSTGEVTLYTELACSPTCARA